MIYRIALASSDGIVVNQHFGHADRFIIAEIDSEKRNYILLEPRNVTPCCVGFDHSDSSFDAVLETLSDVQGIFIARIGAGAAGYLSGKGMNTYEAPYPIDDLLKKIISDKLWEAEQWQSLTKN